MGTKVTFSSFSSAVEATSFSVSESASPLTAGDSSGSTGSFTLSVPRYSLTDGVTYKGVSSLVADSFPVRLMDSEVTVLDDRLGTFVGVVLGVSESDDSRTVTITGTSRLGNLDVFNIQAKPFSGTLANAIKYYASLAQTGLETLVDIESGLALRWVNYIGWNGDLWFHLKQLAMTQDAEIALVAGRIKFRIIRRVSLPTETADTSRSRMASKGSLAQRVEVNQYNTEQIVDELVYPPGGWSPEVQVLNVNAGEVAEYTLQLSSSLESIVPPTMETMVTQAESSRSVYTVVANDGLPVPPGMWTSRGGSVEVTLNEDTTSLSVRLRGAENIPLSTGGAATSFSLALASDTSGSRYSTLRIKGTGVKFDKQVRSISTCVPASKTGTEVGSTVDNIFVSNSEQAIRIGLRLANTYSGETTSFSFTRSRQSLNSPTGETLGNIQGARVFDSRSRRWYRVREATISANSIQASADDDLCQIDFFEKYMSLTYAQLNTRFSGLTYQQVRNEGLI